MRKKQDRIPGITLVPETTTAVGEFKWELSGLFIIHTNLECVLNEKQKNRNLCYPVLYQFFGKSFCYSWIFFCQDFESVSQYFHSFEI